MRTVFLLLLLTICAFGARVKDVAYLQGVRDNQLIGYGIVVGLNGSGDKRQTVFSAQSLASLIQRFNVQVAPTAIQVKNTAAVMITATLPPFVRPGTRIDVNVAAIGDSTSLRGGLLLMTPLRAANGQVFGVAQGPLVLGSFTAGGGGNSQVVNVPTSGRIPQGAIVEQAAPSQMPTDEVRLQLKQADFGTAASIVAAIEKRFPDWKGLAAAPSAGEVVVKVPEAMRTQVTRFVAEIEEVTLTPSAQNKIVVNERTGTIVIGANLRIRPTAILHGNLSVQIRTEFDVSQPNPLGAGQTVTTPRTDVTVKEDPAKGIQLKEGATVDELVRALTTIGSTPRDIIAILESLRAAGALDADLEVI